MQSNIFQRENTSTEDDNELIANALRGSKKSLEDLLIKHQPFVYNIAWKMAHIPSDAEDITQEVMIKVITNLSQFKGNSEFRTWLYRIAMNHFLKMQRNVREETIDDSFDNFGHVLDGIPNIEMTELEIEERLNEVKEMNLRCMSGMLLCLTREQRLVYILGELFNIDHNLGAEIMEISPGNFRVKLSRARKDLLSFMNHKCGLVNKSNPCRCYKKVVAMSQGKPVESKDLLYNREEYSKFKNYISKDADDMLDFVEEKYRLLHHDFPFKTQFDRKSILERVLKDTRVISAFNLN